MAIYESEKMERHIVRLLQNEGLLGKVLLMKPYPALQQVIEAAGGSCAADDGETQPDVIVFCMGLSEKTAQILKKKGGTVPVSDFAGRGKCRMGTACACGTIGRRTFSCNV